MSVHAHAPTSISLEEATIPKSSLWRKLPLLFAVLGLAGLGLAWFTASDDPRQFLYSYLTSFMFWLSLALGALFFVLIHHGTRAGWSAVLRRLAENYMVTLPLFAVLVIPIILGIHDLFHWSHLENPEVLNDPILTAKRGFLNEGAFTVRAAVYVGIWSLLSLTLYGWSLKHERTNDEAIIHKLRRIAPVGYILFALTLTFCTVDWIMSLDPHWYSTIFGVYYFAGCVVTINLVLVLTGLGLRKSGVLDKRITTEHYHDLGKFGFAFIVFWAYIAFSQFLLIWYANIPEETIWYGHRIHGGWEWLTVIMPLSQFLIPFFFLMSRHIKRRQTTLVIGAVWVLIAHYFDLFWLIQPNLSMAVAHEAGLHHPHLTFHIADLLTFIGIGGLVMAVFTWRLNARPVATLNDPRMAESLAFENV